MNPKYPHLISGMLAFLLTLGTLFTGTAYAQLLEQKYVHALAPLILQQSKIGTALQETAFQQPDLLVIYGSSELLTGNTPELLQYGRSTKISVEATPYGSSQFFQYYPTGFSVYFIANDAMSSLNFAQNLAAIGSGLSGKKVVFSFTPSMFGKGAMGSGGYATNFSLLHANALIFNVHLSLQTKQIAAQRMNDYSFTLASDPVLQFAIQQLNCKCGYGLYLYDLAWPLGQLNIWIIQLQDHWNVLSYIWGHPNLNYQVNHKPEQINWSEEISQATTAQKMYSSNNPYGIENDIWNAYYAHVLVPPKQPGSADSAYIQELNNSKEWIDFDLALRVLKELRARPLILSRPINGPIWDAMGISAQARQQYYLKLQKAILPYGFPTIDFADHDNDHYFSIDESSHTSRVGWVYVDMTLDAFFHSGIH